ncbi:MAG TPA: Uma2 family endonuclease [Acetobacteraceae bacterium]|nr:Uma2 family endonuclease [Acetobacteraceae bacterium]
MEAARQMLPSRLSADEFLAWNPADGQAWQLVDGEPQGMAPANRTHGAIQAELASMIRNHLAERSSPCSVITAPGVVPRVQSRINVRVPDLGVTCSNYHAEEPTISDPVLLIEILSPSNHAETWSNVWTYTTIPSVREILIVRTVTIGAELLRRSPDGTWPERPEMIEHGELQLDSIEFHVPIAALYRTTRLARTGTD